MLKGRALLTIDRIDSLSSKEFRWDINANILTCNHDDPGGEVQEAFRCVEYDSMQAPDAAYKMEVGDRIYVLVHYELHFTKGDGYTTDDDADLYYERQRVLKRQPWNDKRQRRRDYAHWRACNQLHKE